MELNDLLGLLMVGLLLGLLLIVSLAEWWGRRR